MTYKQPLSFDFAPANALELPPLLVAARANAFAVGIVPDGYNGHKQTVVFSCLPDGRFVALPTDGLSFWPVAPETVTRCSIPGLWRHEKPVQLPGEKPQHRGAYRRRISSGASVALPSF